MRAGYYDFTRGTVVSDNTRIWGGLDAWASFGRGTLKGEARAHLEANVQESNLFDTSAYGERPSELAEALTVRAP